MADLGFIFDPQAALEQANRDLALRMHDAGLAVFPCHSAGANAKKPQGIPSWKTPLTRARLESLWSRFPAAMPGMDIGRAGLLVIDCDGQDGINAWEAIAAEYGGIDAPYVDTPSGGRHYYFRQPENVKLGNARGSLPPKSECNIDIRGDGGYTIAPGALRADGHYIPCDDDPLCILDAPVIPNWLVTLLTAKPARPEREHDTSPPGHVPLGVSPEHHRIRAYVERAFQDEINAIASCPKGGRNEQVNRSGFALFQFAATKWAGITVSEVEMALIQAAEDCGLVADDGPASVRKTIRSAKTAGMRQPRPIPDEIAADIEAEGLASEIGRQSAIALVERDDGTIINEETGEVLEWAADVSDDDTSELPDELTRVPGLVGAITDWIEETSRRPSRVLALSAALTVAGTVLGRRICGPTGSATHLYVLTLARSGAGKDHALVQSERILTACGMATCIGPDEFMSQTALINRLSRSPLTHCAMDEFGAWMAHINSPKAGPHAAGISKVLRTAWGRSFGPMKTPEWAGKSAEIIQSPALSILGASTPDEFYAALKGRDVINGFLNRFLLLSTPGRPADRDPVKPPADVPEDITKRIESMFGGGSTLGGITSQMYMDPTREVVPVRIDWGDAAAAECFRALQHQAEDIMDTDKARSPFYARTAEMAIRLATIRAAGENIYKPRIDLASMEWGRDLAIWSARQMCFEAGVHIAETETKEHVNKIMKALAEAGGHMTRSELVTALRCEIKAKEINEAMTLLEEANFVRCEIVKGKTKPTRHYFLTGK